MIDVRVSPPVDGVYRETLQGLTESGEPAATSLEAVDMRIVQYGVAGAVVAEGLASDGMRSVVRQMQFTNDTDD